MDQHYDGFFENAQKAADRDKLMKLPRCQKSLKYNVDKFYSYSTKIAHQEVVPNQHCPLQLHPPTLGGSLWLSGINVKPIY